MNLEQLNQELKTMEDYAIEMESFILTSHNTYTKFEEIDTSNMKDAYTLFNNLQEKRNESMRLINHLDSLANSNKSFLEESGELERVISALKRAYVGVTACDLMKNDLSGRLEALMQKHGH